MNKALEIITPSASMNIGLAEGIEQYVNLAIGTPDIAAPNEIKSILKMAVEKGCFEYASSKGSVKALDTLSQIMFPKENVTHNELMLVNGAKYGIYLALKTLCNSTDRVVLMEPYWLSYPSICQSLNLQFVSWPPVVEQNGELTFDLEVLRNIIHRFQPKVLVLNNPNNPSGKVFSNAFLHELNEILLTNQVYLLIDEVYKDLAFDLDAAVSYPKAQHNIVRVGSLSKSLSVPGLRIGYVKGVEEVLKGMQLFNQHLMTCINSLSHFLMENLPVDVYLKHIRYCSVIYKERYEKLQNVLEGSSLRLLQSSASFYALIDFGSHFKDGAEASESLRNEHKILVTPGEHYGKTFRQSIRVCLTLPSEKIQETFSAVLKKL